MSASIRGGLSFTNANSASQQKRRRPSIPGNSQSAPGVPQLTPAERGEAERDATRYPPAPTPGLGPAIHSPYGMLGSPIGGGPKSSSLKPMTPISTPDAAPSSAASSASHSSGGVGPWQSASQVGHPLSLTPSEVSFSSASSTHSGITTHTHHTSGGVSRASSCRSTSSVQAVPMKKPQRGPAVPRIVTRGINALGAYGVGVASPTREEGFSWKGKGRADEDGATMSRPGLVGRTSSSWRRSGGAGSTPRASGNGQGAIARGGPARGMSVENLPSPVDEHASSASSSPLPSPGASSPARPTPAEEEVEAWRREGGRVESPSVAGSPARGRERSAWTRPTYDRADSSKRDDVPRLRSASNSTATGAPAPGSPKLPATPASPTFPQPLPPGLARGSPRLAASLAGASPARSAYRSSAGGSGREREMSVGAASANSMGVVGTRRSTEDFEFGEVLGEGSYSTVTHVTTVHPPFRQYALKVLDKEHIKREKKTKYVLIERDTLKTLDGHPGVIKLWWTFQDEWSLYYVLELAENGELLKWIKKFGSFDLRSARYYTAQILSAVGFMHENGVIHRDLKPENILLDNTMRVKITDFGTAKLLKKDEMAEGRPEEDPQGRPRARSFVGTPEYVSPEVLSEGKESSFSSDFWALGCILFQLLAGRPPFQARTEYLMFQKIINLEYEFPLGFPVLAKELVEKLLVLDPAARLGGDPKNGNGIEAIMQHPFFAQGIAGGAGLEERNGGKEPASEKEEQEASTPESSTAPSSVGEAEHSSTSADAVSTPASSVVLTPQVTGEEDVSAATSRLNLSESTPSASPVIPADKALPPRPSTASFTSSSPSLDSLDGPIDFSTIWTISPPEIRTGLVQPAPVVRGEFVLLDDGAGSSLAPSTTATGLTRHSRFGTEEGGDWGERPTTPAAYGSDEEDAFETASSPTSASGRDLPPASTFGTGKWSNVLLPSETILMMSMVLQRPSSSAAAARTAILRGPTKLKFPLPNPLNRISSPSSSASTLSTPHAGTMALSPASSASTNSSATSVPSPASAAAPPPGAKPRTLILTDYPRLLCIKEAPDKLRVKSEVFLGAALRGGVRREGVSAFIGVEPTGKDGKGFVVKTSSRNYKFDEPSGQAARWIAELKDAHFTGLNAPKPR